MTEVQNPTFQLTGVEVSQQLKRTQSIEIKNENKSKKLALQVKPAEQAPQQQKLPPLQTRISQTSQNYRSKTLLKSQSQSTVLDKKLDRIKQILQPVAGFKGSKTEYNFKELYEQKIAEKFDQLYKSGDNEKILRETIKLEKSKYLSRQLELASLKSLDDKKRFNQLQHDVQLKEKKLQEQLGALEKVELIFPETDQMIEVDNLKADILKYEQMIDHEQYLAESLQYVTDCRKSTMINLHKKINTLKEDTKILNQKNTIQGRSKDHNILKQQELQQEYTKLLERANDNKTNVLREEFKKMLCDELSRFEEQHALNEIFKHEEQILMENDLAIKKEKDALFQQQKEELDQKFEVLKRETMKVEKQLARYKQNFLSLKAVTKITNIQEIIQHKNFLESGINEMKLLESQKLALIKQSQQDIEDLERKLVVVKYETSFNEDINNINIEELEKEYIKERSFTEIQNLRLSKIDKSVDEICISVSRMMYQLKGSSNKHLNVEVDRRKILNSLSLCGLKLERMLAIIQRNDKQATQTVLNNDIPPQYMGLNNQIKPYVFKNFINIDGDYSDLDDESLIPKIKGFQLKLQLKDLDKSRDSFMKEEIKIIKSQYKKAPVVVSKK